MAQQWTDENPGSVDLGVLQSAITDLGTAASAYSDAKRSAVGIAATLEGWAGASAVAWKASAADLAGELGAHRQRLLDAGSAISTYRSTCLDISNRASVHRTAVSDAMRDLSSDPPRPSGDDYEEWQREYYTWQARQRQAQDDLYYAQAMLASLGGERGDADRALVAALSNALPSNWRRTAAALAEVGITGVGSLGRSSVLDAMDELARRILDGDPSTADMEALSALLSMYSENGPALSRFFVQLGGEDTLRLIDSLGTEFAQQPNPSESTLPYDIAVYLREALSVASADWGAATASSFASSMLSRDARYAFDGNAAIAFLFGDPEGAPMGAELSYQVAIGIDQIERIDGEPFTSPDARFDRGANSLVYFDDPDAYERTHPDMSLDFDPGLVDGTGAVFETLGEYPDRAFGFVGSDASASDRIAYWFGTRDWAVPDGFEGPSALWLGASQIEGGSAAGSFDQAIATQEAVMTSRIVESLSGNPSFIAEALSPSAATDLGTAFGLHLDAFAQVVTGPDGASVGFGQETFVYIDPATGEERVGGSVDLESLMDVAGQIGSVPEGAIQLVTASELFTERLSSVIGTEATATDEALSSLVRIDAILDGSDAGATLAVAVRDDQQLRARIEAASSGIEMLFSYIPIAGPTAVGATADVAFGQVIDGAGDLVYGWTTELPAALDAAGDSQDDWRRWRYADYAELLYAGYADKLTLPVPAPHGDQIAWADQIMAAVNAQAGVDTNAILPNYDIAYLAAFGAADGTSGG